MVSAFLEARDVAAVMLLGSCVRFFTLPVLDALLTVLYVY